MSLSFRFASATQAEVNAALAQINPIKPGEVLEVYANADAAGDSLTIFSGTKQVGAIDLGVETAAGIGPIVPDNLIGKWRQPTVQGQSDISIVLTGDNIDLLIVKS